MMAVVVSLICGFMLVMISFILLPDKGNSMTGAGLLILLATIVYPFILTKQYYKRKGKLRTIPPTLRYLLFLPTIFLTTAMMNANALNIFHENDWATVSGFFSGVFSHAFNFVMLFLGPRLFATGQTITLKNSATWAVGCALYFTGTNLDL